jgi:hypothetical protein
MAIFKPVMVQSKATLNTVEPKAGQYIVVIDENELYLDKSDKKEGRVKVSQNIYIQPESNVPTNAKTGDVWFVTE